MIEPVLREFPDLDAEGVRVLVNPTGRFEIGGPKADTGLTGRKIIVDTYGGYGAARRRRLQRQGPHEGRPVRRVHGALRRPRTSSPPGSPTACQLQVAYAIGTAHPVSLMVDTFGTEQVDPGKLAAALWDVFDFRPAAIIRDLDLARPIYRETAAYGHFGRKEFPWEATDRVDELRAAVAWAPEVLAGPVAVCVDRPLLALDRPFTYDLPAELRAGVGSLVRLRFHGRACGGGCSVRPTTSRGAMLAVKKAVSPDTVVRRGWLALCRWVSERYVAPLAAVLERATPPRVAAEEVGDDLPGPIRSARRCRHLGSSTATGRAANSWTRSRPARRGRGCSGRRPSTRAPSWSRPSLDASAPDGGRS